MKIVKIILLSVACAAGLVFGYHVAVHIVSVDDAPLLYDSFLPKNAKNIRFSNRFMGHWYTFNVSREDFFEWCKKNNWPVKKNDKDSHQLEQYEYVYVLKHGNGGGIELGYDVDTQKVYYSYFDR